MSELCPSEVHRIDCLPAEMCMQFGKFQPEKFMANLHRYDEGFVCKLPMSMQNDCEICIRIPERIAKCGAGRFFIQIMDGCQICDTVELELVAECYVSSVEIKQSLPKTECCDGCVQ